jgi:hypothetical protein
MYRSDGSPVPGEIDKGDIEIDAPVAAAMRVDVYSHNVKLSNYNDAVKRALLQYCHDYVQMGLKRIGPGKFVQAPACVYVATTADRREFHFHINTWKDLQLHLSRHGFVRENMDIHHHELTKAIRVAFEKEKLPPLRDYQIPIVEYLTEPGNTKVVTLQTGRGKTFILLKAAADIGVRTVLVIKGMYVDKWIGDVREGLGLKPGELMVVRGSADLKKLIKLAEADVLEAKFIIITNKTIYNYIKEYEKGRPDLFDYGVIPENFFQTLKAGLRVIDEVHQEFHGNFRQDLYTHVEKTISLSATLVNDNPFITRMYEVAYPLDQRAPSVEYDAYIEVIALQYRMHESSPKRVRYIGANSMYSHVMYEQSIMKHKDILSRYMAMILDIVYTSFVAVFEPGQRMLIYASTVEFCTLLKDYLQQRLPDLKIGRYTAEDEMTVLEESDITVSTLKSAGTALDVDGLLRVLMTDAINSVQANVQALGRLRRLKKWPEAVPQFIYLYCSDNPKQSNYHVEKQQKLRGKVAGYKDLITNYRV